MLVILEFVIQSLAHNDFLPFSYLLLFSVNFIHSLILLSDGGDPPPASGQPHRGVEVLSRDAQAAARGAPRLPRRLAAAHQHDREPRQAVGELPSSLWRV